MVNLSQFTIPLWDDTPPSWENQADAEFPSLELFLRDEAVPRPMILLIPSGGYHHLDSDSLSPICESLMTAHCHVAILRYRTLSSPSQGKLKQGPIADFHRAVRLIRKFSSKWNTLPQSILALGFGAGAHLAISSTVHESWEHPSKLDDLRNAFSGAPNALALGHPFVSNHASHSHPSLERIFGAHPTPEMKSFYSLEHKVTAAFPRTFLWHTFEDPQNPAEDSVRLAQALAREDVDCELHIFNKGEHAIDWNENIQPASQWKPLFLSWLDRTLQRLRVSTPNPLNPKTL